MGCDSGSVASRVVGWWREGRRTHRRRGYGAAPLGGRPTTPARKEAAAIAVKEEKIEMEGEIVESLRSGMFRIRLDNGHEMLGYTAGKMKRHRIRMGPGDRVRVEVSAYDLDRGRIVYRLR
jgi:translation initiation factor IF-1